jgi:hypothetical protein
LPAEHWPQAPDGWHAGVVAPQSPSAAHGRQVWVAGLHAGVVPEHCALETQATHIAAGTSQTGVAPAQRLALLAEHWPQAPEGWQAGVAPPHSPSPPHARHVRVPASHTGVAPPQSALARQATQVPVPV